MNHYPNSWWRNLVSGFMGRGRVHLVTISLAVAFVQGVVTLALHDKEEVALVLALMGMVLIFVSMVLGVIHDD